MDLSYLGFAEISLDREKAAYQKYCEEYDIVTKMARSGEITREEWLDRWISLGKKYDFPINPKLLTLAWVQKHLNKNAEQLSK